MILLPNYTIIKLGHCNAQSNPSTIVHNTCQLEDEMLRVWEFTFEQVLLQDQLGGNINMGMRMR
jgi:hypothetical protein